MRFRKAIAKKFNLFLLLLSTFSLVVLLTRNSIIEHIAVLMLVTFALLPLVVIVTGRERNFYIGLFFYMVTIVGIVGIIFRPLRDILPDPTLTPDSSIGYTQYFKYPGYLDALLFYSIIFAPVYFFILVKFLRKHGIFDEKQEK